MSVLNYLILLLTLIFLFSCGGGKAVSPMPADVVLRPLKQSAKTATSTEPVPAQRLREALKALQSENGDTALVLLRHVMEQYPNTPWYRRSLFLTEKALIQLDRPSEADAAMLRVQAEYPVISDYAVFMLAEYHAAKARDTKAAALYQHLMETYPKSSLVTRSMFQRAQALFRSSAYVQAAEAFEKFLKDNPRSEFAPASAIGLGQALTAEGRFDEAVRAYQDAWVHYPGDSVDQDVEKALAELKAGGAGMPAFSSEELYERGKNLYRSNQFEKTTQTFRKLLEKDPDFLRRPDALLMTGIATFHSGRRAEAAVVLEKMVKEHPADPRASEALNWIGKSYSRLGDWDKGIRAFQKIVDFFPESDWADDALFSMGNIYREAGDGVKAFAYYERLAEEYPESKFADSAIWWRAWASYTAGEYQKTGQILQKLVSRYPRSFLVNQAYYWQGRAAEKLGDFSRADALYRQVLKKGPYTYYGYRAEERIASRKFSDMIAKAENASDSLVLCGNGQCLDDPVPSGDLDDGPPVWTEETKKLLAAEPEFKKTLELMSVDMKKEAADELWVLQAKMPKKRGMLIGLSKAFFELGDYYRSYMLVLKKYDRYLEAPRDSTPEDLWWLAYPQAYWESILEYARKYNQDPHFIASVIREESQFNAQALSPAGARGLMQVMPRTGAQVAQFVKLRNFDKVKLYDATVSVNIGTWYIGSLMKRFHGDPVLVAAAYNAGPEAVASWIKKNGNSKDRDVFVESIPFSETRGYVKKVLRNYAEYKRIYGEPADSVLPAQLLTADTAELPR